MNINRGSVSQGAIVHWDTSMRKKRLNGDINWLVVWNMLLISTLGIIIPSDELILFRGALQPPTRYPGNLT